MEVQCTSRAAVDRSPQAEKVASALPMTDEVESPELDGTSKSLPLVGKGRWLRSNRRG